MCYFFLKARSTDRSFPFRVRITAITRLALETRPSANIFEPAAPVGSAAAWRSHKRSGGGCGGDGRGVAWSDLRRPGEPKSKSRAGDAAQGARQHTRQHTRVLV